MSLKHIAFRQMLIAYAPDSIQAQGDRKLAEDIDRNEPFSVVEELEDRVEQYGD